ncbi:MAG: hypothetical protein H3C34_19085 [Caldilineaceae bacterium]|nr:hypothetical protein [Caldilineaceae bacterium]
MTKRTRTAIELYDGRKVGEKNTSWRLGAVLYHASSGEPPAFRAELEAALDSVLAALKASGVRYWYNSVRLAGMLVVRSLEGEHNLPRLLPCVQAPATTDYLFRVFLNPDEKVEVVCYQVNHDSRGLVTLLSPVVGQDLAAQS